MDTLNINLSTKGVSKFTTLVKVLEEPKELNRIFLRLSLDWIEKEAIKNIEATTGQSDWYQVTGTLKNSFVKEINSIYGELINRCFYAIFVEYGTGIYNADSSTNSWAFQYNGQVIVTRGQQAHLFMFNAVQSYIAQNKATQFFEIALHQVLRKGVGNGY